MKRKNLTLVQTTARAPHDPFNENSPRACPLGPHESVVDFADCDACSFMGSPACLSTLWPETVSSTLAEPVLIAEGVM